MKRFSAVLVALLAATIVACGGGGTPPAEAPRKLRFAVIPKSLDIPVFDYAKIGAERAAKELGNVEVIWRGPETGDQLKQKEILESFITQRVDGIAISCLNGDFLTETINRAMDAGIPVVTWDADAPNSKRIAFYVKEDTVKAAELIATGTNRYPDLGAWISVGGWPVFTRNALVPVPKSTLVISFDTIQPAPELLKAGKVQILIGQKYFGWGEEPVKMLAGIKAGRMPSTTIIDAGVDVVRADNVDAYIAEFKRLEAGK